MKPLHRLLPVVTFVYFDPRDALIETDERAIQAIANWHDCMVDGGLDINLHRDDVEFSFQRRLDAIAQGQDPQEQGLAAPNDLERVVAALFSSCDVSVRDPIMDQVESDYYRR